MLFPCIQMPNERLTMVLSRLDAALARLERVAQQPPVAAEVAELAALGDRHRRLVAGTRHALARLDQVIARTEPGAG